MQKLLLGLVVLTAVIGLATFSIGNATSQSLAEAFLRSLDAEQRAKALLPFADVERENWAYTPGPRKGLSLKAMSESERTSALALLRASVSESGYAKVDAIRTQVEPVLRELEGGNPGRDSALYYFTFFGEPSAKGRWGWRYEGHHTSLNFTYLDGKLVSTTPQFLGSNPAETKLGPQKGLRPLAKEEDLGRKLVKSLSEAQRKEAVLADRAPSDLLTTNTRKAAIQENRGIPFHDLGAEQKKLLRELVEEYARVQKPDQEKARLAKIEKDGWNDIRFAWMGGLELGQGHYYRVQGKSFLIEYDNTQNNANHVHAVWRDFEGDFGRDVLNEHYRSSPHHQHPH